MDVLVVGGGLVGLTTAALLADHGVRCLVVERHRGTSIHPRFRGITARSMEIYRGLDLEDAIRELGDVEHELGLVARAHTLADDEIAISGAPEEEATTGISPTGLVAFDQDQLEPLLLDRARDLGATVRFGTELVGFDQGAEGVTAVLRDRDTGVEETISCAYLVAADGARSPVRERLGITCAGPGVLGQRMSMVFRTDLTRALRGRVFFSCLIGALGGATLVRRRSGVWQLAVPYDSAAEDVADFPPQRCVDLLRTATGDPVLEAELLSVLPWEVAAWLADRYQEGRVLLAGDSAHVWPPYGGLNGNTGIQDGHNLAWKLAAVLNGRADQRLLDTYTSERRPVAELTMGWALVRMVQERGGSDAELPADYSTIGLGYRYGSASRTEDPRHPSGEPGTRAPHLPLGISSTVDLFRQEPVLLTNITAWEQAAKECGITAHRVDHERFGETYGVGPDGASLVRPDGFIAWRDPGPADAPGLGKALAALYRGEGS